MAAKAHAFRVNQLRLWLATFAHVLIEALRRLALGRTEIARATAPTIREKSGLEAQLARPREIGQLEAQCRVAVDTRLPRCRGSGGQAPGRR